MRSPANAQPQAATALPPINVESSKRAKPAAARRPPVSATGRNGGDSRHGRAVPGAAERRPPATAATR